MAPLAVSTRLVLPLTSIASAMVPTTNERSWVSVVPTSALRPSMVSLLNPDASALQEIGSARPLLKFEYIAADRDVDCTRAFVMEHVVARRQQHRHARTDRVGLDERGVANAPACQVGDGVQRTGQRTHLKTDIRGSRAMRRLLSEERER